MWGDSLLHRFFDRLVFLVVLHFLILAGTLVGLGIFGIGPALLAAQQVMAASIEGVEDHLPRRFAACYKASFKAANRDALPGLLLLAAFFGLWYVLWYLRQPLLATLSYLLLFLAAFSWLLIAVYGPSLRAFYPEKTLPQLWLLAIVFGFRHFLWTLLLLGATALWVVWVVLFPYHAIFIGASLVPWLAHLITRRKLPEDVVKRRTEDIISKMHDVMQS